MTAISARFGHTAFRRALLLGIIGAILAGFVTVNTITSENLGTNSIKLGNATFAVDGNTSVTATGILVNLATVGSDVSEESTIATFGALNNSLTSGDYAYKFSVFESGNSSWATSTTYTIDVFETTGGVTASLGSYGTLQAASDTGAIEGVVVTVNLGLIVPDEFDIVVSKD